MDKNLLKTIPYILSLFLMMSCNWKKKDSITYFGGKIVNPKTNYVTLFYQDKPVDTLFLDENSKFLGTYKNLKEGLYYFTHSYETQHVYLEPGDSLMLRLNSWDFDESLVFAGKGADRNNMLIDCFLGDESQNQFFYEIASLPSREFKNKIDSVIKIRKKTFDDYVVLHPKETDNFKEVLKIALTYPVYARVERYPMTYVKSHNLINFPKLDSVFYNHRKNTSLKNSSLMYYPPYSKYVRSYLYNKTYSTNGHKPMLENYSSNFTTDLLHTISTNVSCKNSRNAFLKQTVIGHFYNKSTCDFNEDTFIEFLKLSSNEEDKTLVKLLINDAKSLHAQQPLQDFTITDYNGKEHQINTLVKGKSALLFFWNPDYVSESYIISRINFLKQTYPSIQFIEIKINPTTSDHHIQNLDIKEQYYLSSTSKAHQFLTSKLPRSVLVDKNGIVVNGYASIASKNLNPYLELLQK